MNRPGKNNLITDVAGMKIGQAEDPDIRSGVTIVLPDAPAVAALDCRGGGPGTRETDALATGATVEHIHAIVLAGGSAFGLEAAGGVMSWLAAKGRGFRVGDHVVPIVPAAILFDLGNGGDKSWAVDPAAPSPYRRLGLAACKAAGAKFALGNAGAGYGAVAGALKGGTGSASIVLDGGVTVGAIAAVNAFGSTLMPGTNHFWAWPLERDGEMGGLGPPDPTLPLDLDYAFDSAVFDKGAAAANTTLAVVATDAALDRTQAQRVAIMAQDGIARAIRPVHTPFDGDTVFVLATGAHENAVGIDDVARIGAAAADCVARAIARGVFEASTLWDIPGYDSSAKKGT